MSDLVLALTALGILAGLTHGAAFWFGYHTRDRETRVRGRYVNGGGR